MVGGRGYSFLYVASSRLLLFEFRPARVERVNGFLRLVQLRACVLKTPSIARDRRIFERGAFGLQNLFRFMNTTLNGGEFAGFHIRKFLFDDGARGFVPGRASTPVPVR